MDTLRLNLSGEAELATPDTAVYVGFWPRVGARLIDTAVHWGVSFIFALTVLIAVKTSGYPSAAILARMRTPSAWAYVFGMLGFVMYGSVAEGFSGATLGKRLLGMVVLKETKRTCGFFSALGRQVALLIDSLFFGVVGAYGMSTNHRDQRYGDQWFKTVVVKRTSAPPEALRSALRFVAVFLISLLVDGTLVVGWLFIT